jgi:SAM-dependent methyltransferase
MNVVPAEKIKEIYETFVKINYTEEYKNRYVPLPIDKNNKNWKWESKDFPRVIALLEFEKYIEKYNFQIENLLTFNGINDPEKEYLANRFINCHDISYERDRVNNDLHNLNLNKKDYDFAFVNQTLEHVYNPPGCLCNIYNHLKKDGYLYINVPACNGPHDEPYHYFTGFTPTGLAVMAYQAGFKILEIGQWGNIEYMVKMWTCTPEWSDYRQLTNPGLNEFKAPVITWGLFKK